MTRARLAVAFLGILLAIVAIVRDDRRIAWLAIVVLAGALVLRIVTRRREGQGGER